MSEQEKTLKGIQEYQNLVKQLQEQFKDEDISANTIMGIFLNTIMQTMLKNPNFGESMKDEKFKGGFNAGISVGFEVAIEIVGELAKQEKR